MSVVNGGSISLLRSKHNQITISLLLTFLLTSSVAVIYPVFLTNPTMLGLSESNAISENTPLLTWTSRTQNESLPVNNGSSIVGDHVVLNATFPEELNVTLCEMRVWNGFTFTTNRSLISVTDPAGAFLDVINPEEFDWVTVVGIEKGMQVNITANFTNTDSDFMAWPGTMDPSEYTFANNIVDMCTGAKPENDVIVWNYNNDTLVIGCLNYDNTTIGNWTLTVQVGVDLTVANSSSTIIFDSYYLHPRNQTYSIHVIGNSTNGDSRELFRHDVEICNFFSPIVTVPFVEALQSDEDVYNITWSCTDENAEEVHFYSVWISSNDGVSFMLAARNQTQTWFLWDSSDWLDGNYVFRIRAYSVDLDYPGFDLSDPPAGYLPGDYSDGFSSSFSPSGGASLIHNVRVQSVSDFSFYEGSTGNSIVWQFYFENVEYSAHTVTIYYEIYRNGILLNHSQIDLAHTSVNLSIPLDDLSIGHYNYTLSFLNPGVSGGEFYDTVFVTVLLPPTTTKFPDSLLIFGLVITASISVPALVLIVLFKRNK